MVETGRAPSLRDKNNINPVIETGRAPSLRGKNNINPVSTDLAIVR